MFWTVYVLQSASNREIYIGFTNNLKRRLSQHNNKKSFSTQSGTPWVLVYAESYRSREDAKIREKNLKYHGKAMGQLKRRIKNSMLKSSLIFKTER